ncbi:WAS/WASL-interacting protein family member 3-like [Nycticebus coucang]|uniref:WAS/WASL-interacting protein family member 3-like n=1 Tax=Nycticebus coucang TaxID=9470 RepID=UPI00234D27CF|nr:WAS/WASL-interacting protein family member 3-like [Nycticebus coucang]XP_053456667.1 WAS/WASL-interacting protein family member 3-like [Nycticebus coucang]XP_053456668.1 WAS/WASL-interacting protein family member 3-like [Nycticebus coucang]XP_053456669.1 WAS/WASL-interacting protein family member 3-like [Nycticebus coucang]
MTMEASFLCARCCPQHWWGDSTPGQTQLTLDSACSLPWLRSREFGPSLGRPPPLHLATRPFSSAKSSLNINQSSAQTEPRRVSEPSPELRAQVCGGECKQAETGSVNLPSASGGVPGFTSATESPAPLHLLQRPVGPPPTSPAPDLDPSPANCSPVPSNHSLTHWSPSRSPSLLQSPGSPNPCSLLPPPTITSPPRPAPPPPPPPPHSRWDFSPGAVKPRGSPRRHTCLRGWQRRLGAGARSAFDTREKEGGGRARFIIGNCRGHL